MTVEITRRTDHWEFPAESPKAAAAVRAGLAYLGRENFGGVLTIESGLPRGKGMASSTADVVGAIHAVCAALGQIISPEEVARLALGIEPTDGSAFPDIALFDHRSGRIYENLGACPPIDIVVLDFGGEVDTVAFNQCDRSELLRELEPEAAEALRLVRRGLTIGDVRAIGRGATLSAKANQNVLHKPQLDAVIAVADEIDALGVNVGHSGTVVGVLLHPQKHHAASVASWVAHRLPSPEATYTCQIIGGGFQVAY
ncbi:MAG: GHMP kinase [Chloroflexi bacterium]|nr:GHMP kinase [Chloroflexota bacterium]